MPLFVSKVSIDICIFAKNKEDAKLIAQNSAHKEAKDNIHFAQLHTKRINKIEDIPQSWLETIPYSTTDFTNVELKTCSELLSDELKNIDADNGQMRFDDIL